MGRDSDHLIRPRDPVSASHPRRRNDDVATIPPEIDMPARGLPRPLHHIISRVEEVGMQPPGRSADQPRPPRDEPNPASLLERGIARLGPVDIDIDHIDPTHSPGRDPDIGIRVTTPPRPDHRPIGAGILEPVDRHRAFPGRDTREHRNTTGRKGRRSRPEIRCRSKLNQ